MDSVYFNYFDLFKLRNKGFIFCYAILSKTFIILMLGGVFGNALIP